MSLISSGIGTRIEEIIAPALGSDGYEIVRIRLMGSDNRPVLQIMLDRLDGKGITLDDCTTVSHTVSALLDVEDPIASAYSLEVSSPGIDRPLVRTKDFERYAGHEAKLETMLPLDGRRRFRGILGGMEAEKIKVRTDDGKDVEIPFATLSQAKLVLTDILIAQHEAAQEAEANQ